MTRGRGEGTAAEIRPPEATPPPLHVVVTDRVLGRPGFGEEVRRLRAACGSQLALHLRLRQTTARAALRWAREAASLARLHGGWCVVNGRVDVAMASGAQGVQLGSGALALDDARRLLGDGVAVGRSVHGQEEARSAAEAGANYLLVGTIYPTPTHPGRSGAGPELVRACARLATPVIAIGGIDRGRVRDVREAGARGVAVVRAVWEEGDPVEGARRLLDELKADGTG